MAEKVTKNKLDFKWYAVKSISVKSIRQNFILKKNYFKRKWKNISEILIPMEKSFRLKMGKN